MASRWSRNHARSAAIIPVNAQRPRRSHVPFVASDPASARKSHARFAASDLRVQEEGKGEACRRERACHPAHDVYHVLAPDGTPISANQFMELLFGKLPEFFKDEDELRALWSVSAY